MTVSCPLVDLHRVIRDYFPTSPHYLFEAKKNYPSIKAKVDAMFEAEFDLIQASRKLEAALTPMGFNHHYYTFLAPCYGEIFRTAKAFEKELKATLPELKEYYSKFCFISSDSIFGHMQADFEMLSEHVQREFEAAKGRNPNWKEWEDQEIRWDAVKEKFKEASKAKGN